MGAEYTDNRDKIVDMVVEYLPDSEMCFVFSWDPTISNESVTTSVLEVVKVTLGGFLWLSRASSCSCCVRLHCLLVGETSLQ